MKKILFFALSLLSVVAFSQAPQFLNYQGIARDASNNIITSNIGIKFEILQGSSSGTLVYEETNTIIPSAAGVFTAAIGGGSLVVGTFSGINWANGPYFITVSIDPAGGTSYSTVGTSQLLSVPYALYAQTSGSSQTFIAGNGITINSGTITNAAPNQTVNISGPGVLGAYPNFTVTSTPATTVTAGNSNITVSGASPSYTISSVPSLSLSGAQLSISNGNTVNLPTGTTYTNGSGIALTSGTIITNTAPDQTVTIANGTNVNVTGVYPNFVVNSTPSLSIAGNTLSITGGTSVVLPGPPVLTPSTGISILGGTITNTAPNQTVTVTGPSVTGSYPTYNVAAQTTSVTAGNSNITVSGSAPNLTVASSPTLTVAGNNLSISNGNTVPLPSYSAGAGLALSGASPNFTLSTSTTGTNVAWNTLGNAGTIATSNFIGTTDNIPLNFRVNNQKAGRIDHLLSNAFYGYQAGNANTSGVFNTAFGNQALLSNNTGSNNAAIGTNALYFNTSGINNTATGYQPLYSNTSGGNNTANGYQALYTNSTGNNNTALGAFAGKNTTGTGNVFLGYSAGAATNSSDKLYIANSNAAIPLIYGDFSTGYVGLGTNTPGAMLDLVSSSFNLLNLGTTAGNSNINIDAFPTGAGVLQLRVPTANGISFVTNNIGRMWIDAGGNIGIGTTNPTGKLEVAGSVVVPTSSSYRYATPKTKHLKIGAAEMTSASSASYSARIDDGFSSATINGLNSMWASGGAPGNPAYFIAPVHLPDSALIVGLNALVIKNGGSLQSVVELWRTDGAGYLSNSAQLIATSATSFSGGIVQSISAGSVNPSFRVVDNATFFYFIRYIGEQNNQSLRFTMADVTYQILRSEY